MMKTPTWPHSESQATHTRRQGCRPSQQLRLGTETLPTKHGRHLRSLKTTRQKPCVRQLCFVLRDEAEMTMLAAFERPPLECRPLHQAVLRLDKR